MESLDGEISAFGGTWRGLFRGSVPGAAISVREGATGATEMTGNTPRELVASCGVLKEVRRYNNYIYCQYGGGGRAFGAVWMGCRVIAIPPVRETGASLID